MKRLGPTLTSYLERDVGQACERLDRWDIYAHACDLAQRLASHGASIPVATQVAVDFLTEEPVSVG